MKSGKDERWIQHVKKTQETMWRKYKNYLNNFILIYSILYCTIY